MDALSQHSLGRLIAIGSSSLLQYFGQAVPWTTRESTGTIDKILALAKEERDETAQLTRWLQKRHVRLAAGASFPSHFTTMNFVSVDYLLPKLIAECTKEIADIERLLDQMDDEEIRRLASRYLDMKRRHLQTLQSLTAPKTPVAV